jgi:DNA topoisomerase VI subunit A
LPRASTASDPVVTPIAESGRDVHGETAGGQKPSMKVPLCSFSNVRYTPKRSHVERVGKKKGRTLTASTVETLAQTLRGVALSKRLVRHPSEFPY